MFSLIQPHIIIKTRIYAHAGLCWSIRRGSESMFIMWLGTFLKKVTKSMIRLRIFWAMLSKLCHFPSGIPAVICKKQNNQAIILRFREEYSCSFRAQLWIRACVQWLRIVDMKIVPLQWRTIYERNRKSKSLWSWKLFYYEFINFLGLTKLVIWYRTMK